MAGELSAGFCSHCNRAVTIRKKNGGLLKKITALVGSDAADQQWECTRCGKPAGKAFTLPQQNRQSGEGTVQAAEPEAEMPPPEAANIEYRDCPHCRGSIRREAFKCLHCNLEVTPLPRLDEAKCHVCGNIIKYEGSDQGQIRPCATCTGLVTLPAPEEGHTPRTTPPPVQKLPDDPNRPTLTLALCSTCDHHFTYQNKHAGRKVSCPSCHRPFTLP